MLMELFCVTSISSERLLKLHRRLPAYRDDVENDELLDRSMIAQYDD